MDEDVHFIDEVGIFDEHGSLIAPLEGVLVHLNHTMQLKKAHNRVALFDHATLIIRVLTS
jgi:hypothetical protein